MCGIAGVAGDLEGRMEAVRAMTAALAHRGPDDEGFFEEPRCALGHRRLSILDLSPAGHQPMASDDGAVQVSFNGEIYNFAELRRDLEAAGARFRSRSDTEVIVRLYQAAGDRFLRQLRGMFALALWDGRRGRLLLARDHFGQKPLFWAQHEGALVFASELKAMLRVPGLRRELDSAAVDRLLALHFIPSPHTMYRAIHRLPPASVLTWEPGRAPEVQRYWRIEPAPAHGAREPELLEQADALLGHAVKEQLVADVPVGIFLSGGIDSGLVLAKASEAGAAGIDAFSIGFAERAFDESPAAARVAARFGARHHVITIRQEDVRDPGWLLDRFDEPFPDIAALPLALLARAARARVKVALTGDGGDEMFGGYYHHLAAAWIDRLRSGVGLRSALAGGALAVLPDAMPRRLRRLLELGRAHDPVAVARALRTTLDAEARERLYQPEFAERLAGNDPYADLDADPAPGVTRVFHPSGDLVLADEFLYKTDVAAMSVGLECRSPLLDVPLAEWAARVPIGEKVRGLHGKHLLRKLLGRRLGDRRLWARRKAGLTMPVSEWLRGPLAPLLRDHLLAPSPRIAAWVKPREVARLVEEHLGGHVDRRRILWALLLLELWLARGSPPP